MNQSKGSSDESIGRPEQWREGRYEQNRKPVTETVHTPPGSATHSDTPVSTPVTPKDYGA
jgi:hypothetical protein